MLDDWIQKRVGGDLAGWRLRMLNATLSYAMRHSSYYRKHFDNLFQTPLTSLEEIARFPFTDSSDISRCAGDFLCVPASRISRAVTLETSGTTGRPKRIFFTEEDLELMVDFVANGMAPIVSAGEAFLILMPCEKPDSVGDLVRRGLERADVMVIAHGPLPSDGSYDAEILKIMQQKNIRSLLATASAAKRLALAANGIRLRSVLLSAEYISDDAVSIIEAAFGCTVFEHYGMTEMGLGGAVSCSLGEGYHVREADLLFEIIDPSTGEVVPDGVTGELVFTTLTRAAMPLIRYRTGDFARLITEPCPCGSTIRRISRVADRHLIKGY